MTDNSHKPASLSSGLVTFLLLTMGVSSVLHGALSVISGDLIEEFGLTRSQFGWAPALLALVGALVSPATGRMADRSLRGSTIGLYAFATAGTLVVALGPVFAVVLVGSMVAGVGASAGNPVTNRIVSLRMRASQIGMAVGIKQAGPQLGLFVAGLILPSLTVLAGWRVALLTILALPLAGLVLAPRFLPGGDAPTWTPLTPQGRATVDRLALGMLAVISGTIAIALSTVIAFAPLYVREELGMSATEAGLLAAVLGIVGLVGRALWAMFADRLWPAMTTLILLAIFSAIASGLLWAATANPWLAWIGAFLAGASLFSWPAVAWVVLLSKSPGHSVGRHSGTQGLAVGLGFAIGPPAVGALIDAYSYGVGWAVVVGLCIIAATLLTAAR